jgi:hypothetical protein
MLGTEPVALVVNSNSGVETPDMRPHPSSIGVESPVLKSLTHLNINQYHRSHGVHLNHFEVPSSLLPSSEEHMDHMSLYGKHALN